MRDRAILEVVRLGFPWATADPFLFCAHHDDAYPAGTETLGPPPESLIGRNIGQDFTIKDGWRMYHGAVVPGFPAHPHRGFETVTIVQRGLVDHSDSLGAAARFGAGDVQWVTAGRGIVHSEMFPLLDSHGPNPLELFQVWLNLPRTSKMAEPHFTMFWAPTIPVHAHFDAAGRQTTVTIVAGGLGNLVAPAPPPESWAARPEADVAIWVIRMEAHAEWTLPPTQPGSNRTLYFFRGHGLQVGGTEIPSYSAVALESTQPVLLRAGADDTAHLLLLQGRPIGEPVAQYGPFVMNTAAEIRQAFADYRETGFGGWPWPDEAPIHGRAPERFARYPDGRVESGKL